MGVRVHFSCRKKKEGPHTPSQGNPQTCQPSHPPPAHTSHTTPPVPTPLFPTGQLGGYKGGGQLPNRTTRRVQGGRTTSHVRTTSRGGRYYAVPRTTGRGLYILAALLCAVVDACPANAHWFSSNLTICVARAKYGGFYVISYL